MCCPFDNLLNHELPARGAGPLSEEAALDTTVCYRLACCSSGAAWRSTQGCCTTLLPRQAAEGLASTLGDLGRPRPCTAAYIEPFIRLSRVAQRGSSTESANRVHYGRCGDVLYTL